MRKKTAPATPYTLTAAFLMAATTGIGYAGICFRQSSDGKMHGLGVGVDASTSVYLASRKLTNATTYSADYTLSTMSSRLQPPALLWMRIADNGTNRICSYSSDGVNFLDFHSVSRTDFLTADEIGFFIDPYSTTTVMTLLSWKQA